MATDEEFERFGKLDASGSDPLYETLALSIAEDEELLAIAEEAPDDQSTPHLFFAAVQYLLLERPDDPLAAYYPSIVESPDPPEEGAFDAFREFCLAHRDEIARVVSERRVQTNIVRRSAILLFGFEYMSRRYDRAPLGLVDMGATAGLNLLWDKYAYDFEAWGRYGDEDSPVRIPCGVIGRDPPFPERMPPVGSRIGIDLNPLDVTDDDDARWLRALVWPGLDERRSMTENAIAVARQNPPEIVAGDVLEELRDVCDRVPADERLCLFNTHSLNQLMPDQQLELAEMVGDIAAERDLSWLWCELPIDDTDKGEVQLTEYTDGEKSTELLAYHDPHGRWIDWQA